MGLKNGPIVIFFYDNRQCMLHIYAQILLISNNWENKN